MRSPFRCQSLLRPFLLMVALLVGGSATAATIVFNGRLNDPSNAALVGSGSSPSAPSFTDDYAIANNVAIYSFLVPSSGPVRFLSIGFVAGGIDPYFTLFSGSGPSATFVSSNFAHAFSVGGDFDMTLALTSGPFTLSIGAFANMSSAENLGSGTLGDGFVGLGVPSALGDYSYDLLVTTADGGGGSTVPEPATPLLVAAGALLVLQSRYAARVPPRCHRFVRSRATA